MALDGAGDAGDGVGRERGAAIRVVGVDRLDERERRDLLEVLERLAAAREPACEAA
jgi:hypothetical protein